MTDSEKNSPIDTTPEATPEGAPDASPENGARTNDSSATDADSSFEKLSEEPQVGIIREFVDFLKYNKKWWLTPIILLLALVGLLIALTTSGAAPFLYPFW